MQVKLQVNIFMKTLDEKSLLKKMNLMNERKYICSKCKRLSIKELKECWYCGEDIIVVEPPKKQEPHAWLTRIAKPIMALEIVIYSLSFGVCLAVIFALFTVLLQGHHLIILSIFMLIILLFMAAAAGVFFVAKHSYKMYKEQNTSIVFTLLHELTKLHDE